MPDVFIPEDTTALTSYYREALFTGLIRQFAFAYTDANRDKLMQYPTASKMEAYLRTQSLLEQFARFADKHSLRRRNLMLYKSRRLFERAIYGNIIYNALDMSEYIQFLNESDPTVLRAVDIIEKGESVPQKPQKDKKS